MSEYWWRCIGVLTNLALGLLLVLCGACKSDMASYKSCATGKLRFEIAVKDNSTLMVQVQNTSRKPITMRESRLPWAWRYSMLLKAFEADALGTPLDEVFPIADRPVMDDFVRAPKRVLKGEIDLPSRFPQLREVLEKDDVILFWSYPLPVSGSGEDVKQRLGGWFLLSRGVPRR